MKEKYESKSLLILLIIMVYLRMPCENRVVWCLKFRIFSILEIRTLKTWATTLSLSRQYIYILKIKHPLWRKLISRRNCEIKTSYIYLKFSCVKVLMLKIIFKKNENFKLYVKICANIKYNRIK